MITKNTLLGVNRVFGITDVVQQLGKNLHLIGDEIVRWRKILEVPYREFSLTE